MLEHPFDDRRVRPEVDPKFSQAMGIEGFRERVRIYSNSRWQFLLNDCFESPYFTSDYPIVYEQAGSTDLFNKVVPLSPTVAVRIIRRMDPSSDREGEFMSNFQFHRQRQKRKDVVKINKLLVRAAENIVIYRDQRDWVLPFVRKNASYRTVSKTDRFVTPEGTYVSTRRVLEQVAIPDA